MTILVIAGNAGEARKLWERDLKLKYVKDSWSNVIFPTGNTIDGLRPTLVILCGSYGTNKLYPHYVDLYKQCGAIIVHENELGKEKPYRTKGNLTVNLKADTSNLQRQLEAITKHAKALAADLASIDDACEVCGKSEKDIVQLRDDAGMVYEEIKTCLSCGFTEKG